MKGWRVPSLAYLLPLKKFGRSGHRHGSISKRRSTMLVCLTPLLLKGQVVLKAKMVIIQNSTFGLYRTLLGLQLTEMTKNAITFTMWQPSFNYPAHDIMIPGI